MTDETPAVRASDAEREQTVARLRDATAEGRLSLEEFAQRADRAFAATDLPGRLDQPGRLVLLRRLVREGFLRLA